MSAADLRRWAEVKALFQQAIDLQPDERPAFLARASEDSAVRAEVASLLTAHEDARPFLDTPPIAGAAHAIVEELDDDTDAQPPALEPGTRIAHYEILERLGRGGMGDVYRARDTTLDRFVALKIVHDAAATGCTADRVLREARAASALNHPHICTVYEVGEVEGRPYLAMEYVAGQSLHRIIPADGLPVEEVVRYGAQVADALAHAHERGVIHRDLKGANVAITADGRAKVLDFGIARRLSGVGVGQHAETLTQAGTIVGTPAYMAPELLRGQTADARSDIWALGVLLYEMASGRRPFAGETPFEVASAILKDVLPPLPSRVPAGLRALIVRCLAREADDRFQRVSDVIAALDTHAESTTDTAWRRVRVSRRLLLRVAAVAVLMLSMMAATVTYLWRSRASAVAPSPISVAVLPFTVSSQTEEMRFLGIGLPDAIIARLGLVRDLRVPPMTAVLAWEKQSADPRRAGRELSVEYVLTGSVDESGAEMRVTPQLVRAADGAQLWTRAYTLSSADLLALQAQIVDGVVEALAIEVTSADRERMARRDTRSPEAYGLYVRGRSQLARVRPETAAAAVESFEAAIQRDRDYALAYAGVAAASAQMRLFFATEANVSLWETRAHEAARRALQLDPALAEAHEALAAVYRHAEFDWHQAIEESDRALALNPNLDQPHLYRASAFMHLGLLDRVAAEMRAVRAINPANVSEPLRVQGAAAMYGGRFAEAVALLEQVDSGSGRRSSDWNLAYAYYYAGRQAQAKAMLRALRSSDSARTERRAQATLASILAARGQTAEARDVIRAVTSASYMDHHVAYSLGAAYAQLGLADEAIRWLTQARSTGFPCYPWFARDPLLAPLRTHAAFQQFLEELKRSSETAAVRHPATPPGDEQRSRPGR